MPVSKLCATCGKAMSLPPSKVDLVKYCCWECRVAGGYRQLTCEKCGVVFKRKASDHKSERAYCSTQCSVADHKGRPNPANRSSVRYFKTCELCGTEFRVTKTRSETARFCSIACKSASPDYAKENSDRQLGEKSHRWTGGKYKAAEGYKYAKWQNHRTIMLHWMLEEAPEHHFLVEVDGFKRLADNVEVHHIDRVRENNARENLLVLTKHAHWKIHSFNKQPEPGECWPPNPSRW